LGRDHDALGGVAGFTAASGVVAGSVDAAWAPVAVRRVVLDPR
jgi:hypothetical protein